jgi:RNA polymerase sigma-70 factor (ECF subfamily)
MHERDDCRVAERCYLRNNAAGSVARPTRVKHVQLAAHFCLTYFVSIPNIIWVNAPNDISSTDPASDARALLDRLCSGDSRARIDLVESYTPFLCTVLRGVAGRDGELQDLLQETYKRIFERLPTLREPLALKGWMARIATLTALEALRTRRRAHRIDYVSFADLPDRPTNLRPDDDATEALECLHRVLCNLPSEERRAFVLRRLHGLDLEAVADACGVSPSTVKRRFRRAEKTFYSRARSHPALKQWVTTA